VGVAGIAVGVGGTGLTGAGTGEQADIPKTITINEKAIFFMQKFLSDTAKGCPWLKSL
jgi:hypothetical protein